ncbi:23011_t:CDS:2 [Cetraspora pellucida]|uniref:23011_t:CDS:1 n=1 Tax=Cetraspora pellucida TaxID=1433469 RepID=A0A9N9IK27_9GLOM|nr:23011_t:CDS:2 [Cetraspora pellucida]
MNVRNELNQLLQEEAYNHSRKPKPSRYPNNKTQVRLLSSLLAGPALAWFAPLFEKKSALLNDFNSFIREFKTTFGDSNKDCCGGNKFGKFGKRGVPTVVRDTLVITVSIQLLDKSMFFVNTLIDSDASACFLNYMLAHQYNLPTRRKKTLLSVEVIDGQEISSEAVIYETKPLMIRYQDHCEEITFNLIQTPHYQAILELIWLAHHNPNINWCEHILKFPDAVCILHI